MFLLLAPTALANPSLATQAWVAEFQQDRIDMDHEQVAVLRQKACTEESTSTCEPTWKMGDLTAAAEALLPACESGDSSACMVVAWNSIQTSPGVLHKELPGADLATTYFKDACAAGIERGCVDYGVLLTRGTEGEAGLEKAQELFQTACQVGELAGCRRLGAMFHSGQAGRDLDKARKWYGKACDAGHVPGCNGLALIDHLGVGVERNPIRAEANYLIACDAGLQSACGNLNLMYKNGIDPKPDPEGALKLLTRGCERGIDRSCANGGRVAGEMLGQPEAAGVLFKTGCDRNDPTSCGLYGAHLLPTNTEKGTILLERTCEMGLAPSCYTLGRALKLGEHVDKDKKRGKQMLASACEAEYEPACGKIK